MASAEHVRIGTAGGFMQVCRGKAAPLRRVRPGDVVAYYSPTATFGHPSERLQSFTAIGVVEDGEPYRVDMGGGFLPFRRDVGWLPAREASIQPLLPTLDFTAGKPNWGYPFRFGLFAISERDMTNIAAAMQAEIPA